MPRNPSMSFWSSAATTLVANSLSSFSVGALSFALGAADPAGSQPSPPAATTSATSEYRSMGLTSNWIAGPRFRTPTACYPARRARRKAVSAPACGRTSTQYLLTQGAPVFKASEAGPEPHTDQESTRTDRADSWPTGVSGTGAARPQLAVMIRGRRSLGWRYCAYDRNFSDGST